MEGRRTVIVAMLFVMVVGVVQALRSGEPALRRAVAAFILTFLLSLLSEFAPKLAGAFAVLVAMVVALSAESFWQTIAGTDSRIGSLAAGIPTTKTTSNTGGASPGGGGQVIV